MASALIGLDVSQMSFNLLAPRATKLNIVALSRPKQAATSLRPPWDIFRALISCGALDDQARALRSATQGIGSRRRRLKRSRKFSSFTEPHSHPRYGLLSIGFNNRGKKIAAHPHGLDEAWIVGIVLDLVSQSADVNVDAPFNGTRQTCVSRAKQFFPAEYPAGVLTKDDEQVELGRRHVNHGPIRSPQRALPCVEAPPIESERLWQAVHRAIMRCPSQHAADPGNHFPRPEGTGDAIISSAFESGKDDVLTPLRNDRDDRDRAEGTDLPAQMKRIFGPDDGIEDHQIKPVPAGEGTRPRTESDSRSHHALVDDRVR